MDQDLHEADDADTLRVRLSSSKVPSRAPHTHPADVDMDVISLVSLPEILKTNNNKRPIFTKLLEPYTHRRAAIRFCIRTTHETMGQ
jgi:hypothetical protein